MPEHNLPQTVALLSRTPAALDALLRDLPDEWTLRDAGDGTWNVLGVIGHLIHCERVDWIPRVKIVLEFGESRTFDPLDRQAHVEDCRGKSLGELLDEFARLRAENLRELESLNLKPEDFRRRGRHPELGTVTLAELVATMPVHDLTHLQQIARILAHQYRDQVGPWRAYLGVLK
jgi:hypothetical protein